VNTNTTIPTVVVRDQETERYLCFDWTDGQGIRDSVTLGLADMHADPTVHADIARNVMRVLQHTYLKGVDAGEGIITGIEVDRLNAELVERNQRQESRIDGYDDMLQERNARITQLEAALASALRVCDDKDEELRQVREVAEYREGQIMHGQQRITEVERRLTETEDQRDAVADSLGHLVQASVIKTADPELEALINDDEPAPGVRSTMVQVQQDMLRMYELGYSEGGSDVGMTYDNDPDSFRSVMYDKGRNARIASNEAGQRIEALMAQNTGNVQEAQRRYLGVIQEFDGIAEALLQEAIDRNWCADYEAFAHRVNDRTRTLKLQLREKTYTAYFTVTLDTSDVEYQLSRIGDVYDVSCETQASYNVSAQFTCGTDEDERDTRAQEISEELGNCSYVDDVTLDNIEEDDS
jgi:hypothetical protein